LTRQLSAGFADDGAVFLAAGCFLAAAFAVIALAFGDALALGDFFDCFLRTAMCQLL
jgi:hypothetical protein